MEKVRIFPIPRKLTVGSRHCDYSALRRIVLPGQADDRLKSRALEIAGRMAHAFAVPPEVAMGTSPAGKALVTMNFDNRIKAESYTLDATRDGFLLRASDSAGWFYGLLSIEQVLLDNLPSRVPELSIEDGPDIASRGYMLDVSRCKVPTLAQLKQVIDDLSRLRYNELQLYIEHTFAFEEDERVWFDNSPLTPAEIIELDLYCRERFIELVPNLNSFGHLERWLRFPEYQHLAESPKPWYHKDWDFYCQGVVAPGDAALAFIDRLYAEYLPNFSSKKLNIGCDETLELGQGRSKELCDKLGTTRVYFDFLLRLAATAKNYGKSVQFWGDIIMHQPELIKELPKDITALEWGYEADHPFKADTAKFKAAKVPFYVCPGTSSWNSFIGRTDNMLGNIVNALSNGKKAGAAGMLMTDWGDGGHHHYWPISWPGLTYAAGCAWNVASAEAAVEALPWAISWGFCPEARDGRLGELLLELGRVVNAFQHRQHNCGIYFLALFGPKWAGTVKALEKISREEVHAARRLLASCRNILARRPPAAPQQVLAELDNGMAMADCALLRLAQLKGSRIDRGAWRDAMRHVIGRHSDLWLTRNRPGGLAESSEALRRALQTV